MHFKNVHSILEFKKSFLQCCECVYWGELQELIFMITINFLSWMRGENQVSEEREEKCGAGLPNWSTLFWHICLYLAVTVNTHLRDMMVAASEGGSVTCGSVFTLLPPQPSHQHLPVCWVYLRKPNLPANWAHNDKTDNCLHVGQDWTMLRISSLASTLSAVHSKTFLI